MTATKPERPKRIKPKKTTDSKLNTVYLISHRFVIWCIALLGLALCFAGGTLTGYVVKDLQSLKIPSVSQMKKRLNQAALVSTMTYSNQKEIGTLQSDVVRTSISSQQISPVFKQALIDTEDPYFYQHHGIVPKALLRALVTQLTGQDASGGSTLTQQLVKQQFLTNEPTLSRKIKEIALAIRIEHHFSKNEILTAYLNVTPFGRNNKGENIAGIDQAARGIFGVRANQLTLPQAAFIAGLPQSPMVYTPYTATGQLKSKQEMKYGLERKDIVLENMYRHGQISYREMKKAQSYPLQDDFLPPSQANSNQANYLYFAIRDQAIKTLMPSYFEANGYTVEDIQHSNKLYRYYYHLVESRLASSGYKIQSTIDQSVYEAMQKVVADKGKTLDDGSGTVQVGDVLLENTTGRVLGFVGGRDFNQSQNNHALQTKRSPASTMKPILAYAPAVDNGIIHTETMLDNYSFSYSDQQAVTNYGGRSGQNFESVREALLRSDNIPVLNLYCQLQKQVNVYDYAQKMNLGLSEKQVQYESAPLGTGEMTVMTQAGAYATLANQGIFNQPYLIESITDHDGNVIYEHEQNEVQVYSATTASIMNRLMYAVLHDKDGTGYPVLQSMKKTNHLANGDWVGKTGTSEDFTDYWFTASTPSITLSSWVGYDNNAKMSESTRKASMQYWVDLANAIYQTDPDILGLDEKFADPDDAATEKVSNQTGTKFGSFEKDGTTYTVHGKKITAYATEDSAFHEPSFRFGIGGTDENYMDSWKKFGE